MDIESLKAKAGAEHQRTVATIETEYKNKRSEADAAYERRLAFINALGLSGVDGIEDFIAWTGSKKAAFKEPAKPHEDGTPRRTHSGVKYADVMALIESKNGEAFSAYDLAEATGASVGLTGRVMVDLRKAGKLRVLPNEPGNKTLRCVKVS